MPRHLSLLEKAGAPPAPALPPRPEEKSAKEHKPVPFAKLHKLFSIYSALHGVWDPSPQLLEAALEKIGACRVVAEGAPCYTIEYQGGSRKLAAEKKKICQVLEACGIEVLWEVPVPGEETFVSTFAFIYSGWLRRSLYVLDLDSPAVFEYSKLGHSADAYAVSQDRDRRKTAAAQKCAYYLRVDSETAADESALKSFVSRALAASNWSAMTLAKPEKYSWLK